MLALQLPASGSNFPHTHACPGTAVPVLAGDVTSASGNRWRRPEAGLSWNYVTVPDEFYGDETLSFSLIAMSAKVMIFNAMKLSIKPH